MGLQAQSIVPPFVGLWTRLEDFRREDLARLIERHAVVRATMMRHTLHLVAARDYLRMRPAIQPALTRNFEGFTRKRLAGVDVDGVIRAGRERLRRGPATFAEIRNLVEEVEPGGDVNALAYAVRTHLALVQVPGGGRWGYSTTAPYALAEDVLGERPHDSEDPAELIRRYLAAFGPAKVADVQAWSGLAGLKAAVERLRPKLRVLAGPGGMEVFDVPDGPLPAAETPVPARFLPEFDNVLLAFADRSRVIADEHRRRVFLAGGRVRATFLIDGFVRGTWKLEKAKRSTVLAIEPFGRISKKDLAALFEEGERLARFVEEDSDEVAVRVGPA